MTETPYTLFITHYVGLVEQINYIYDFTKSELARAKKIKDSNLEKEFILLVSEVTAMKQQHEEGLIHWKAKEEEYLKKNGNNNKDTGR